MTCKHDWEVVTTEASGDGRVLYLFCEFCRSSAHMELTAAECDEMSARMDDLAARRPGEDLLHMMTMHDIVHDLVNRPDMQPRVWIRSTHDGGDDDLLTAGDDDQINAIGTMSWTVIEDGVFNDDAAAEFQAHIFDQVGQDAPTSCTHIWFVTATYDDAGQAMAELQCTRCHEYARVSLTDDECETMAKGWEMGLCFEWDRNRHRVMMDRDVPRRPAVADLINTLDLFEGEDDDDIPF